MHEYFSFHEEVFDVIVALVTDEFYDIVIHAIYAAIVGDIADVGFGNGLL